MMMKLKRKIIEYCNKYRELLMYGIAGVLTTIINILSYKICYEVLGVPNVPSTAIAWVLAVIFAFFVNKVFVFESRSFDAKVLWTEMLRFFACRIATGVMDLIIMYVAVDVCQGPAMLWKILSNILVIIGNYVAGRFLVFRKDSTKKQEDSTEQKES